MSDAFDVLVIGAGPGGYVAAIRAAQLGFRTAVVEREHLGGICLNWGCIPTKALLRSAEVFHLAHEGAPYGVKASGLAFDLEAMVKRSRAVSAKLQAGVRHLLRKNKVEIIEGSGTLVGGGKVRVSLKDKGAREISAKHIILATGARPRVLPGLEPDGKQVWTYREAMTPQAMPKSLLVVGSGAIGVEFASFYRTLGAEVTIVEVQDRILPVEDEEISTMARQSFERQGIRIVTSATVKALAKDSVGVTATITAGGKDSAVRAERVILAVGITANTEQLGLENTRVKLDRGRIVAGPYCETDEPGVYAIGDLTGAPWLAHKASHEAVICVEKIAGLAHVRPLDVRVIPGCTYCHPQIASVGLSERKAKELGHAVKVGRFPFVGNGKAIALGDEEGMIKTVFDAKTGELLGAHMMGPDVTELIHGYGIAMSLETTEAELMHAVFPHPTLSEAMHESVLNAYGHALHI
ncbi:dihydrolipoyl dehydrogenase [Noviherbaspirillum sp.]|uniref:dihydrolipoyl dehydrogenase n=1 Tax=Noviherbaspirillum sp. TaxID=1926288 RepID=UPI002B4692F3|nr:dihydrolipoyl dehydrogenase [Noviherbaspirillum sp.]HJV81569.1 dihydrolipoyl dehydrogenase [Noviherbaspirillum sp.]